jgi:spore maturation protein CgeB
MTTKSTVVVLACTHPENWQRIQDALAPQDCAVIMATGGEGFHAASARNRAAALAETDNIIFLDDDHIPAPDFVAEHERCLDTYAVSIGLEVAAWNDPYSDGRLLLFENETAPLSWMTHSGNLGTQRSAFMAVGGFDGKTFDGHWGWEDTCIGWRLGLAGFSMHLNRWARALNLGIERQTAHEHDGSGIVNKAKFDAKREASKRVLVVSSGHMVSTYDVWRGWDRALRQAGHNVHTYNYHSRIQFYNVALRAWKDLTGSCDSGLVDMAGEGLPATVLDFEPDVIVVICGLVLPPQLLPLIRKLRVPIVSILTESPYSDENQSNFVVRWSKLSFANDRSSLARLNQAGKTVYLPHSYDPLVHFPRKVSPDYMHDVFFFGTLYPERRMLFDAVDWGNMDVSLSGTNILDDGDVVVVKSRGHGFSEETSGNPTALSTWQTNEELARHYCGSKINLQMHRTTADYFRGTQIGNDAYSLGPRAFEIPACGALMVSDASRPELREVFCQSVPAFHNAEDLQEIVHDLAESAELREMFRAAQHERVQPCTFRNRLDEIVWPEVMQCL